MKEEGEYIGEHLLDTFHILRNIAKKTKNQELIRSLRDAMFAKTDD
jgi:hypothetical protein